MTEVQRNAFTYFLQEAGPSLERNFGSREWIQIVSQTAAEIPMVFNAVTAVGCMMHARSQILMTDHALTQLKTGLTEEAALSQYCEATCQLQMYIDAAVSHGANVEPVLLCSLLFVLFETFRGEPLLASSHLRHGRRALDGANSRETSASHKVTRDLLLTLDASDGDSVPCRTIHRARKGSSLVDTVGLDSIRITRFNIKEALDALIVETSRWRQELLKLAEEHVRTVEHSSLSVAALNCVKHCLSRSIDTARHPTLLSRGDKLKNAHKQWLENLRSLSIDLDHQNVRLLRIQHFYSYFLIRTSRYTTDEQFKNLDNDFRRALDLVESYLDHGHGADTTPVGPNPDRRPSSFSLEPGLLSVLFLVSLNCRDSDLRYRAMNLLRHANRREGLQLSSELSIYADCINEFEDARGEGAGHRPLDWWFERIPEPARRPKLAVQGSGWHEIRIYSCTYLRDNHIALELVELGASGVPPLHLDELSRSALSVPISAQIYQIEARYQHVF